MTASAPSLAITADPVPARTAVVSCFHCGLPIPTGTNLSLTWDGVTRPLCCRGCQAVANTIVDAGIGDYYRFRTAAAAKGDELVPDTLRELAVYDHPSVQRGFVRDVGEQREAALILDGITCAACIWLNEQQLKRLEGVHDVQVNYATRRARVIWDDKKIHLSGILKAIRAIGYDAHPYDAARSQQLLAQERRALLRRLGVAGIMAAQVMTLSEALYFGDWSGSDPMLRTFFSWISLALTLPVLLYSARPFFRAAANSVRHARVGMDVLVTLGIGGAFAASAVATITGNGIAYYDAVTMFVFLLLGGRYLELAARARASESVESLIKATPASATRLNARAEPEQLPVAELVLGDLVLVRPGETIPADGVIRGGLSSVNESLLTGESRPIPKAVGDTVIGGSINIESPLTVRVDKTGTDTVLSAVLRLLDRAQTEKPRIAEIADRVAAWFVIGMLVVTALVGAYWWQHDATRFLPIVIAVLIVTCPCALALATPTALTAATSTLARNGMLVTRGHALETLARATHFVFDKTGTLTLGQLHIRRTQVLGNETSERCLTIAAALEQHSEHPIACAIVADAATMKLPQINNVKNRVGAGLSGVMDNRPIFIGTPAFIAEMTQFQLAPETLADLRNGGGTVVLLATTAQLLAAFVLNDTLRPGAAELIAELKRYGRHIVMLTGDHSESAMAVAKSLGIDDVHAELTPAAKLARLQAFQQNGAIIAMAGDGINDAPVLVGAQVSIAMNNAADIAAASADMVLLSSDLRPLAAAVTTARRTTSVIRQNLTWAILYNLLAVPTAATGVVAPWVAALGMSTSSLLVVANAWRLHRRPGRP